MATKIIVMDDELVDRLRKYAYPQTPGGFQSFCRKLLLRIVDLDEAAKRAEAEDKRSKGLFDG